MPQPSRTVVLIPKANYASGTATFKQVVIGEQFTAVNFILKGDAATGTSPTLNIYVQGGFKDIGTADLTEGTNTSGSLAYFDWHSWTQLTTGAPAKVVTYVGGGTSEYALTTHSLAAATFKNGPIPAIVRVEITVGGTNPNYPNLYMIAQFIP
jgi:hypothetical protein